jgi:hypothetical protein
MRWRENRLASSTVVGEAAVGSVRETLKEQGLPAGGNVTFVQARTAHEIAKAHLARLRLQRMKGELVERARATALVFRLAREERDSWLNWPARVAALIAADLGVDAHAVQKIVEAHVRGHLAELAEFDPSFAELIAFDGAEELGQSWRDGLRPDPSLTVSEWADRHRLLAAVIPARAE